MTSTWALLKGLKDNGYKTKNLTCVDINNVPAISNIAVKVKEQAGINLQFIKENSATVKLPVVDLLFIDTWHVYAHLIRELEFHHDNVRKYIIMHNTEVDKIYGESTRLGLNVAKQSADTGYAIEDIKTGLQAAIDKFTQTHTQWVIHKVFTNNHGLTILKRK